MQYVCDEKASCVGEFLSPLSSTALMEIEILWWGKQFLVFCYDNQLVLLEQLTGSVGEGISSSTGLVRVELVGSGFGVEVQDLANSAIFLLCSAAFQNCPFCHQIRPILLYFKSTMIIHSLVQ